MRVLIVGLNYAPELIGVGKYTAEFASWLQERGHDVRVITAPPYYPAWRVSEGYQSVWWRWDTVEAIPVLRCPLWVPKTPAPMKRILHLLTFALASAGPTLWQALTWRPEVIWTVEPTATAVPAVLMASKICGATACLHIQDIEVEAAISLRMLPGSWLVKAMRAAYGWMIQRFDLVSTISDKMRAQMDAYGVDEKSQTLFPNWVETDRIYPQDGPSSLREELGLADDRVIALYAGNLGEKQCVEGLAKVAELLVDAPLIHVVIAGDGSVRSTLESTTRHLPNVTMLPLQPPERLNDLLNLADIHLLPQRRAAGRFALPSKFGGMLASGRPVVVQAEGGELAMACRDCGILLQPDDFAGMARAVRLLAKDPARRRHLGASARQYVEPHLARDRVIGRYLGRLEEKVEERQSRGRSVWNRLLSAVLPSNATGGPGS